MGMRTLISETWSENLHSDSNFSVIYSRYGWLSSPRSHSFHREISNQLQRNSLAFLHFKTACPCHSKRLKCTGRYRCTVKPVHQYPAIFSFKILWYDSVLPSFLPYTTNNEINCLTAWHNCCKAKEGRKPEQEYLW